MNNWRRHLWVLTRRVLLCNKRHGSEQAESAPAEPNGKAEDKASSKGKPEPAVAQDSDWKAKEIQKSQDTATG